jgi:hypothetical protein
LEAPVNDEIGLEVEYQDFEAYHDNMGKSSRVTGVCVIKGAGVAATLMKAEPQGINPEILELNLDFTITAEDPSAQPVEWHEEWDGAKPVYTKVHFSTNLDVEPPQEMEFTELH